MPTHRQKLNTYALTLSTWKQHRHFQRLANAELFVATLLRYRANGKFQLHGFVVMPDHVHILLTPAIDQSTARCIQLIKGGYSHAAGTTSIYPIWHSGRYEHRVRDSADFHNQLAYIANNPVRRRLEGYPHVHTRFAAALDSAPPHLTSSSESCEGQASHSSTRRLSPPSPSPRST